MMFPELKQETDQLKANMEQERLRGSPLINADQSPLEPVSEVNQNKTIFGLSVIIPESANPSQQDLKGLESFIDGDNPFGVTADHNLLRNKAIVALEYYKLELVNLLPEIKAAWAPVLLKYKERPNKLKKN
jgi:hypothetical protein